MTIELDIWRSAKLMIDRHGEDAATEAALRADKLLAQGATTGAAIWRRIMGPIEYLLDTRPPGQGKTVQ